MPHEKQGTPRAIFINSAGEHSADSFCGRCTYAVVADETGLRSFPGINIEGKPVCAKFNLGNPLNWEGHCGIHFREELLPLTLWKCQMNYWLLVEGITHDGEVN